MKHIAKLFAPALALTLSLSLAACGGTSPASVSYTHLTLPTILLV